MHVIARKDSEGTWWYLIEISRSGAVRQSVFWADAAKFHDARAAYEYAEYNRQLRDSDEWMVKRITPRSERTS